jgi:hypothetical protein
MRVGTAQAPLHGGRCPPWLFKRMRLLARAVTVHLVEARGRDEFLRRLSDPLWFHAFGCVLGFDWNSSGVTTTVCGALKDGLAGTERELGLFVCGGKGGVSRGTPEEIARYCDATGLDGDALTDASRLSAKVDSACVQDGYTLYHHTFLFTAQNRWAVVQQGLRETDSTARRYHWLGGPADLEQLRAALAGRKAAPVQLTLDFAGPREPTRRTSPPPPAAPPAAGRSFVRDPHSAVAAQVPCAEAVLNLVAGEAEGNRSGSVQVSRLKPTEVLRELSRLPQDALVLPRRHDVRAADVRPAYLERILLRTYERKPENYESLVALPGVGAKTLRALSLVSELIYAQPAAFRDPARFSYAHGGKDGHPYPVDREVYDQVIQHLGETVSRAQVSHQEKADALKRLAEWGRA